MRIGKVVFLSLLGFCVSANAQYDENIMLDLSVLDSLGGGYSDTNKPLFPVLPKETKKIAPKKIRKKVKKTTKQQEIVKAEKVSQASQKDIKETKVVTDTKENIVVVDKEPALVVAPEEAKTDNVAPIEIKPVDVEPAPFQSTAQEQISVSDAPVAVVPAENNQAENNQNESMENEAPIQPAEHNLLIEETPKSENKLFSLTFASDSDELTTEQMSAIDNEVGKYKNEKNNKIAIYSYNLDDGVDSFRKKRISLNRALAVRTYLIKQEYKNFSIKVININGDSDKVNTVELEEI